MTKFYLLSIVGLLAVSNIYGQQGLTLHDAINAALKNSYDIQLAKNNVAIATINNNVGIAGGLPSVSGLLTNNEQIATTNQQYANPANNIQRNNVGSNTLTAGVTGSILLYNGLRVVATQKRLAALQLQNQELLNLQIQNTLANVMLQYFDVLRQQYYLTTITQSINVSQERLSILQTRKTIGVANNADLFQAQLDLNALIQQQQSQQLVIGQSKTNLLTALFLPVDSNIILTDSITVDTTIAINQIITAIENHPQLKAAAAQIVANELIEKETAAQRYPTLRANTGFNFSNNKAAAGFNLLNQSYGPFVGFNLNVPIYNGGTVKRQQQIAKLNTQNAIIAKNNYLRNYQGSIQRNYLAYTNSLIQLKTEQANYQLALQLLDLVLQKFKLGQATIIDLKLAQQSFENESYRLANLNYTAKVAEIGLKQMANLLSY